MNNPFAYIVIGNLGNLYPEFELSESMQIVTRHMAKKNELDQQIEVLQDKQFQNDEYTNVDTDSNQKVSTDFPFEIASREELLILQKSDQTLDKIRELANGNNEISRKSKFLFNEGLLYRYFHCETGEVVHQIVVPEQFREKVIELAHDTLCGGHMGNRKT